MIVTRKHFLWSLCCLFLTLVVEPKTRAQEQTKDSSNPAILARTRSFTVVWHRLSDEVSQVRRPRGALRQTPSAAGSGRGMPPIGAVGDLALMVWSRNRLYGDAAEAVTG